MLHEIQPGDVLIVTLANGGNQKCTDSIGKHISGMGISADIFVGSNATETSVHVIRAKKAEDKPKPDLPEWRDANVEKPPRDWLLWWSADNGTTIAYDHRGKHTHWMPLPEGPK